MVGTGPNSAQGIAMRTAGVALIRSEAVSVMEDIEIAHPLVAEDLRDNRCCGDARNPLISCNEGAIRQAKVVAVPSVHEGVVGSRATGSQSAAHRESVSGKDAERVDFVRIGPADPPGERGLRDAWSERAPLNWG